MEILTEELRHPIQASLVRLHVYETDATPVPVHGTEALLQSGRYLVTEDRIGSTKVVATLGSFATRAEALALVRERVRELETQRYSRRTESA